MRVLVVNAGSSSLKLSLVDEDDSVLVDREFAAADGRLDEKQMAAAIREMQGIEAIGHRIVHGGPRYANSVRIDGDVIRYLVTITDLAPLHIPAALAAIAAAREVLPRLPGVACLDTAFHARMPAQASTYAIPEEWRVRYGVKRYGFHGFSHAYASKRAAQMLGRPTHGLRVVSCHLGAGASLAAVQGGRSMDTTMGFTPLEGLVMATRAGTVDPGAILYLARHAQISELQMSDALDRGGGLLALAGTGDMRVVLQRIAEGDERAELAFDVYVHRLRALIASMAAAMNGLDVLVFTGGVGENAAPVRAAAAAGLRFLGVAIDPWRNTGLGPDNNISVDGAPVPTLVIKAREDIEVAREVRRVLASAPVASA
ncbi:MAG TPA: acetate/propionate family kinase [Candidatus Dormibacteraeota bacterium]|nr:acetate/propionate family kinase [Candidatus Dormibacteraeota bacterium]